LQLTSDISQFMHHMIVNNPIPALKFKSESFVTTQVSILALLIKNQIKLTVIAVNFCVLIGE